MLCSAVQGHTSGCLRHQTGKTGTPFRHHSRVCSGTRREPRGMQEGSDASSCSVHPDVPAWRTFTVCSSETRLSPSDACWAWRSPGPLVLLADTGRCLEVCASSPPPEQARFLALPQVAFWIGLIPSKESTSIWYPFFQKYKILAKT